MIKPMLRPLSRICLAVLIVSAVGCTTTTSPTRPAAKSPAAVSVPAAASAAAASAAAASGPIEVRFICLAPSPYSHRHDALRAGFGIFLSLRALIQTHGLPLQIRYYDGAAVFQDADQIHKLLQGPQVIVLGGSTWAQGTAYYLRRFLELASSQYLGGVSVSAGATAGGSHTGGEAVISTTLRSLMGMGAQAFTLGQKYLVFTTDERIEPSTPGAFSNFDLWYMDQFARQIAVVALAGNDRQKAQALSKQLGTSPHYYLHDFPPDAQTLAGYDDLRKQLNEAADPNSDAYRQLTALLSSLDSSN